MKDIKKDYAVLLYHEDFICRYLKNNSYALNYGAKVYCKDSTRFWNLLARIRQNINKILLQYPDCGKVFLYEKRYYEIVR